MRRTIYVSSICFLVVVLSSFFFWGCEENLLPTDPGDRDDSGGLSGLHKEDFYSSPGFYFLPPMVEYPEYSGDFDPALSPVVEVCESIACETLHASFSMTEGVGSEVVRLVEEDEHYIVNWHSGHTGAEAGQTYHVRVRVGGVVPGYTDVEVVATGREAASVRSDGLIALVAGQTLPVKFRIETGIPGAVVVTPAEATIDVGGTQQFSAALYDLHGEPLVGPTITWSSGDTDVATVDADGLATGLDEGEATITASAGPASGTAQLTVSGSPIAAAWHAMGTGMTNTVWALTHHNGGLVAGGSFTTADGQSARRVARWDGTGWHALGDGIPNGTVRSLADHGGDLVAGGSFWTPLVRIAQWDGLAWQRMGIMQNSVLALTIYEDDPVAGGFFQPSGGHNLRRVGRWDGAAWQNMHTGMNAGVHALHVHDLDLIAAGDFTNASGRTANRIARWDGDEWQRIGSGFNSTVRALTVFDGDLVAGGSFTSTGGKLVNYIARWDGSAWVSIGSGMDGAVWALTVHDGELIAGGTFLTAGGQEASYIARWNGSAWMPVGEGMNEGVRTLIVHDGDLVAGGSFTTAGGEVANHIARWGTP